MAELQNAVQSAFRLLDIPLNLLGFEMTIGNFVFYFVLTGLLAIMFARLLR